MLLLIDTDVAVDIERMHAPAKSWLQSHAKDEVAIAGFTAIELVEGCANKLEARRVQAFINRFLVFWPLPADSARALDEWADIRLAHGIGIGDMMIAQTALGLGVPLQTFNTKHYRAVPGLTIEQPYER